MKIVAPKYGHGKGYILGPDNFYKKALHANIKNGGHLPHWQQENVMQFITFRLADSLPQEKLKEFQETLDEWIKQHPGQWSDEEIDDYNDLCESLDKYLDTGFGECVLKFREVQNIVESAIKFFDGDRYDLFDYIIMPNHVHLLLIPSIEYSVEEITHSIKSYTAKRINTILGKTGKIWQRESFDRMLRSFGDYVDKVEYIKHNGDNIHV